MEFFKRLELLRDGEFGENGPYKPLVFESEEIKVLADKDKIEITFSENTKINTGFNFKDILETFNNVQIEEINFSEEIKYRLEFDKKSEIVDESKLYKVEEAKKDNKLVLVEYK
ncbi:hypothetical protein R0K17_09565 [Planococcus sp. SIMBA_143]